MEKKQITENMSQKMKDCFNFMIKEFNTIHTGKASPSIVENILVEAYGSIHKLKELSAILTPSARSINIQPWDKTIFPSIIKSIQKANIGLNPVAEGAIIRCPIPQLSGERRNDLIKISQKISENCRISIRSIRKDTMDMIKKEEKLGNLTKDDITRYEKEIQKITNQYNNFIASSINKKEIELRTV